MRQFIKDWGSLFFMMVGITMLILGLIAKDINLFKYGLLNLLIMIILILFL